MRQASFPTSHADALEFDTADPLASKRAAFSLPDGVNYLVGHSLGPPPRQALDYLKQAAETDWAEGLVGSWNKAEWIDLPKIIGAQLARLIGVEDETVIVCDSVSINLFKLVGALIGQAGSSCRIVVEAREFPTDQYILERLAEVTGVEFLRLTAETELGPLRRGDIFVKSLVDYRTSRLADAKALEHQARKNGFNLVWDLSHATGLMTLKLAEWGVRYAVGCTYKYLNGGPGAPAFLYVNSDQIDALETPLAGWLGHARPFGFEPAYAAADGVQRFVAGTPPILSMMALKGALELFETIDMDLVQAKARTLGDMCLARFERLGLTSHSPQLRETRGGHVSFEHPEAYALSRVLAERGHQTDFRTPTTIRFGLSPLFLRYADVWETLEALEIILTETIYQDPKYAVRSKVT